MKDLPALFLSPWGNNVFSFFSDAKLEIFSIGSK